MLDELVKIGEEREKEHEVKHHVEEVKQKMHEELIKTEEQREKEHEAKHHIEEVRLTAPLFTLFYFSFFFVCLFIHSGETPSTQ